MVETIKLHNGRLCNIEYHSCRYNRSRKELHNIESEVDLASEIIIPHNIGDGVFKCRIVYDSKIQKIEFLPYRLNPVHSLRLVEAGKMNYIYKYSDRSEIDNLMMQRKGFDDILIIKNGMITDTSYANIIVRDRDNDWYTPSTYLLKGTKREYLLDAGIIKEMKITAGDLGKFTELRLINSMIDINDTDSIAIKSISS